MGRVAGLSPDETRQRVLDAAAEVFGRHGFEGARIAEIAREAGLSVGAIYNHYASKADLLAAVVERHGVEQLNRLLASDEPLGVLDLIEARGRVLEQPAGGEGLLAEVILAARRDPATAEQLRHKVKQREALLADVLRFAQAAGEVDGTVDAAAVVRLCLMLGLGSLLVRVLDLPAADPASWSALVTRLVDGFRTEETSS